MIWLVWFALAVASGVLGRMGGAHGYDTKFRDVGCSLIIVLGLIILLGWHSSFWWVYGLVFVLSWAAFCTYWDTLFGYDNMWFSGFMAGLAASPVLFMDWDLWPVVLGRAVLLCIIWGALNKFLPAQVLCWRRDVAEEFSRYFVSL